MTGALIITALGGGEVFHAAKRSRESHSTHMICLHVSSFANHRLAGISLGCKLRCKVAYSGRRGLKCQEHFFRVSFWLTKYTSHWVISPGVWRPDSSLCVMTHLFPLACKNQELEAKLDMLGGWCETWMCSGEEGLQIWLEYWGNI